MLKETLITIGTGATLAGSATGLAIAVVNNKDTKTVSRTRIKNKMMTSSEAVEWYRKKFPLDKKELAEKVIAGAIKVPDLTTAETKQNEATDEYAKASTTKAIKDAVNKMKDANVAIIAANKLQKSANQSANQATLLKQLKADQKKVLDSVNGMIGKTTSLFEDKILATATSSVFKAETPAEKLNILNTFIKTPLLETTKTKIKDIVITKGVKGINVVVTVQTTGLPTTASASKDLIGFTTPVSYRAHNTQMAKTSAKARSKKKLAPSTLIDGKKRTFAQIETEQETAKNKYTSSTTKDKIDESILDMEKANRHMVAMNKIQKIYENDLDQKEFIGRISPAVTSMTAILVKLKKLSTDAVVQLIKNHDHQVMGAIHKAIPSVVLSPNKAGSSITGITATLDGTSGSSTSLILHVESKTSGASSPIKTTDVTLQGFISKDQWDVEHISASAILAAIKTQTTFDSNTLTANYNFPSSITIGGPNGATVTLTNAIADSANGSYSFHAKVSKGSFQTDPVRSLSLTGFKGGLTDDQRIKAIQTQLDTVLAPIDQLHSGVLSEDIADVDHEIDAALSSIVVNAYGIKPTISSQQTADGTYTFTVTYTGPNGKTAAKTITLSGYMSYADYKKTIHFPTFLFDANRHWAEQIQEIKDTNAWISSILGSTTSPGEFDRATTPTEIKKMLEGWTKRLKNVQKYNTMQLTANLNSEQTFFLIGIEELMKKTRKTWVAPSGGPASATNFGTFFTDINNKVNSYWINTPDGTRGHNVSNNDVKLDQTSIKYSVSGLDATVTFNVKTSYTNKNGNTVTLPTIKKTIRIVNYFMSAKEKGDKFKLTTDGQIPGVLKFIKPRPTQTPVVPLATAIQEQTTALAKYNTENDKAHIKEAIRGMKEANVHYTAAAKLQEVANAKFDAFEEIEKLTIPTTCGANHDQTRFNKMTQALTDLKTKINAPTTVTVKEITDMMTLPNGLFDILTESIKEYDRSTKVFIFDGVSYATRSLAEAARTTSTSKLEIFKVPGDQKEYDTEEHAIDSLIPSTIPSTTVFDADVKPGLTSAGGTDLRSVHAIPNVPTKEIFVGPSNFAFAKKPVPKVDTAKNLDGTLQAKEIARLKGLIARHDFDQGTPANPGTIDKSQKASSGDIDKIMKYLTTPMLGLGGKGRWTLFADSKFGPNSLLVKDGHFPAWMMDPATPTPTPTSLRDILEQYQTISKLEQALIELDKSPGMSTYHDMGGDSSDIKDFTTFWKHTGVTSAVAPGRHHTITGILNKAAWDAKIDKFVGDWSPIDDVNAWLLKIHNMDSSIPSQGTWANNAHLDTYVSHRIRSSITFIDDQDEFKTSWENIATHKYFYMNSDKSHAFRSEAALKTWFKKQVHHITKEESLTEIIVTLNSGTTQTFTSVNDQHYLGMITTGFSGATQTNPAPVVVHNAPTTIMAPNIYNRN